MKLILLIIVFVANASLNPTRAYAEDRPRPHVIAGGNPGQREIPWPKSSYSRTNNKRVYDHLNGTLGTSTYYQRAYKKVYSQKYYRAGGIKMFASCAPHRYGVYNYGSGR